MRFSIHTGLTNAQTPRTKENPSRSLTAERIVRIVFAILLAAVPLAGAACRTSDQTADFPVIARPFPTPDTLRPGIVVAG